MLSARKLIWLMIIFVLSLTTLAYYSNAKEYGSLIGTVVRVYDGDTFTVSIPDVPPIIGDEISIRINGIDTPELRGDCQLEINKALEAKLFIMKYLSIGKQVELIHIQRDKYFRILADVIVDNQSLSTLLINNDLAHSYSGGTKEAWCPTQ